MWYDMIVCKFSYSLFQIFVFYLIVISRKKKTKNNCYRRAQMLRREAQEL